MNRSIGVLGTASYLPTNVITNEALSRTLPTSDEWIRARTGIQRRRWSTGEPTSALATRAARTLVAEQSMLPRQLVVATSSPDQIQPSTACLVQQALELSGVPAYDVGAVCSGFVYALVVASAMASSNPDLAPAMVIGAERYSPILDPADRTATVFFGDGAGAVMLGEVPHGYGILGSKLAAHGEHFDAVGIRAGGTSVPATSQTIADGRHYFHMDGRAVWNYATTTLPVLIKDTLVACGLEAESIDLVITHQANLRMIEHILDLCSIRFERTETTVTEYGNTAAASIPITLDQAYRKGRLKDGDIVLLAGVGGGMTSGCVVLRWFAPDSQLPNSEESSNDR